jgi:hypothetical protein
MACRQCLWSSCFKNIISNAPIFSLFQLSFDLHIVVGMKCKRFIFVLEIHCIFCVHDIHSFIQSCIYFHISTYKCIPRMWRHLWLNYNKKIKNALFWLTELTSYYRLKFSGLCYAYLSFSLSNFVLVFKW